MGDDEEERAAFLKAEADELEHQKKQDRMLKRQLKTVCYIYSKFYTKYIIIYA